MATSNPNHIFWQDIRGVYDPTTGSYIFGDQTGNARGAKALDIQSFRGAATQVASGAYSIAIGYTCTASGNYSTALGNGTVASGESSVALGASTASGKGSAVVGNNANATAQQSTGVGYNTLAAGIRSTAIGYDAHANSDDTVAMGSKSVANITKTANIIPQIVRKDNSESDHFLSFSGAQITLWTNELDLKTTASDTITIPAGAHFFPDEVGVEITSANTVTVQPTVRFGNSGNHAALLAAIATTGLTAALNRQRFQTLVTSSGQADLVGEVTIGATATTLLGRMYFKGVLVEDE